MSQQEKETLLPNSTLAERIRSARMETGLSMRELARFAGVDVGYISRIENGKNDNLGSEKARLIASALKVAVEWLLTGQGAMQQLREPQDDYLKRTTQEHIIWLEDQLAASRANETRLLQIVETLSTLIAGPRPEQGRAQPEAPGAAPAARASGALYKSQRAKTA